MRIGVVNYMPRAALRQVFDEALAGSGDYAKALERYVSVLYSSVQSLINNPFFSESVKNYVYQLCSDVSIKMFGFNVATPGFPLNLSELVGKATEGVMEWVRGNEGDLVKRDRVLPKREALERYTKTKALEYLRACLEQAVMSLGVVE